MTLAVTQTGNHYLVDSLAGALVALLAVVGRRLSSRGPGRAPGRRGCALGSMPPERRAPRLAR